MLISGISDIRKVCMSTPTNRSRTRRGGFLRHLSGLLFFSLLFLIFSGIRLLRRGRRRCLRGWRWIRLRRRGCLGGCLHCFRVSQTADAGIAIPLTVLIGVATARTRPGFVLFHSSPVAVPIRVPETTGAAVIITRSEVATFRADAGTAYAETAYAETPFARTALPGARTWHGPVGMRMRLTRIEISNGTTLPFVIGHRATRL